MDFHPYVFRARVDQYDFGKYAYTCVYMPDDLKDALPLVTYPRLRVTGDMAGIPFEAAWQPTGGDWYLILSKKFLSANSLSIGDEIEVSFGIADQDAVHIHPDLQEALEAHPDLLEIWQQLSAGKRRGYAHHINTARTSPTRDKRIDQILGILADQRAG